MWGAIIGDLAGSIHEYGQVKKVKKVTCNNNIIVDNSFYSDDTILTIAVLDAILNSGNYEYYLKMYGKNFKDYRPKITPYFKHPFSPGYMNWIDGKNLGNSTGNGSMMRISPVAYLFNTEKEVLENVYKATIPSHNSEEAIKCASIVAKIIYYARCGIDKKEILNKVKTEIDVSLKPFEKFNTTCYDTISNCLYCLFYSNSFNSAIKNVIALGGDTDTNACIVGSMAEALYGIDNKLIIKSKEKLPQEFTGILDKGYEKIKKLNIQNKPQ